MTPAPHARTRRLSLGLLHAVALVAASACQATPREPATEARSQPSAAEISASASTDISTSDKAVESAVRAVLDTQVEAWNRADMDGFLAPYWRDPGLTFFSGGNIVRGFDLFESRFRERYTGVESAGMGRLEFRTLEIVALGPSAALARGQWHLEREGVEPAGGLFSLILRDLPNGWHIVHDQTSTFDQPPLSIAEQAPGSSTLG